MNIDIVELQKGCRATCVIIQDEDVKELKPIVAIKANISNKSLFCDSAPNFAAKISEKSENNDICYLAILGIDTLSESEQNKFVPLVKDRYMNNYSLPENCIIVFTVKDKNALKKISPELYHFAIVAF